MAIDHEIIYMEANGLSSAFPMYIIIYAKFPFRINTDLWAFYCALPHAVIEHLQHISDTVRAHAPYFADLHINQMANFVAKTNRKHSKIRFHTCIQSLGLLWGAG